MSKILARATRLSNEGSCLNTILDSVFPNISKRPANHLLVKCFSANTVSCYLFCYMIIFITKNYTRVQQGYYNFKWLNGENIKRMNRFFYYSPIPLPHRSIPRVLFAHFCGYFLLTYLLFDDELLAPQ